MPACEHCHNQFEPKYPYSSRRPPMRFCSLQCVGLARRKPPEDRVRAYDYTRNNGKVQPLHRVLFISAHGNGPFPCHWCGTPVSAHKRRKGRYPSLRVDHKDGNTVNNAPDNLVASCHRCNTRRTHPGNIGPGEAFRTTKDGIRHRATERVCENCGEGFLFIAADKRPNRGRFCSRSCARRHR